MRALLFGIVAALALQSPGEALAAESVERHPVRGIGQPNQGDRGVTSEASVPPAAPREVPVMSGPANYYQGPAPPGLTAEATTVIPPPALAESAAPPPLGTSFEGIPYTGFFPPDTQIAAGPNGIVEVVNGGIRLIDKTTGASLVQRTLDAFYNGQLSTGFTFDPSILHDPHSHRFIAVAADGFTSFSSWLRIAVSKTPNPANLSVGPGAGDDWCGLDIDADIDGGMKINNNWADFPRLGVDRYNFYVTANMYSDAPGSFYQYSKLWVIRKESLLNCAPPHTIFEFGAPPGPRLVNPVTDFRDFTVTPAINYDFAETRLIATNSLTPETNLGWITVWTVNDPAGTPTLTGANINISPGWNSYTTPDCPQKGSATPLDTGDTRMLHAVQRQGSLWATHTQPDSSGTRTQVKWYEFDYATNTVRQNGVVTHPDRCYFYPAIQPDSRKDVCLVFSGVAPNIYGSAFTTSRNATDPPDSMRTPEAPLKAGEDDYFQLDSRGRNRWGDFGGISEDPLTRETWMAHEYAKHTPGSPTRWSTWIGKKGPERPQLDWWELNNRGIWRVERRAQEIARSWTLSDWTVDTRLWVKRRMEGVWIHRPALTQFNCHSLCVIRNPSGPGVWRISRWFRLADVQAFWWHLKLWWTGHLNPLYRDLSPSPFGVDQLDPLNRRFSLSTEEVAFSTPMEPEDPDPGTPGINEGVQIQDENGVMHLLGEPGFEQMPDTAENPGGFRLISSRRSTTQLPPPTDRIEDAPVVPEPGMVETAPGVLVEWLKDDLGNTLVDDDEDGIPDDDRFLMRNARNYGTLAGPGTGIDLNELAVDLSADLPMNEWLLDATGEVLDAPGEVVVGPSDDEDGDAQLDIRGAPVPMEPVVFDEDNVVDPSAVTTELAVVEEDEPDPAELADFNDLLVNAGLDPLDPGFNISIRSLKNAGTWRLHRRVVWDKWFHRLQWKTRTRTTLSPGVYRFRLTKSALSQFTSLHHHQRAGQPPIVRTFDRDALRFFRLQYRIFFPGSNEFRIKIDGLTLVVPEDDQDPGSDLMVITTDPNLNNLPSPDVLSGGVPDPLTVNEHGFALEELIDLDALDIPASGDGILNGMAPPAGGTAGSQIDLEVDEDLPTELNDNQLRLHCLLLDATGAPKVETLDTGGGPPLDLLAPPATALPAFTDEASGETVDNPTMFEAVAGVETVPTLTEWGIVLLVALLLGGTIGVLRLGSRRESTRS